jgi:hypothetical protein
MEGRIDKELGVPTELLPARVNCLRSGSELDMQLSPHDDVPFVTTLGPIADKKEVNEISRRLIAPEPDSERRVTMLCESSLV